VDWLIIVAARGLTVSVLIDLQWPSGSP